MNVSRDGMRRTASNMQIPEISEASMVREEFKHDNILEERESNAMASSGILGSPKLPASELTEVRESFQDSNMDTSEKRERPHHPTEASEIFEKINSIRQTTESVKTSDPVNTSANHYSVNFSGLVDQ